MDRFLSPFGLVEIWMGKVLRMIAPLNKWMRFEPQDDSRWLWLLSLQFQVLGNTVDFIKRYHNSLMKMNDQAEYMALVSRHNLLLQYEKFGIISQLQREELMSYHNLMSGTIDGLNPEQTKDLIWWSHHFRAEGGSDKKEVLISDKEGLWKLHIRKWGNGKKEAELYSTAPGEGRRALAEALAEARSRQIDFFYLYPLTKKSEGFYGYVAEEFGLKKWVLPFERYVYYKFL